MVKIKCDDIDNPLVDSVTIEHVNVILDEKAIITVLVKDAYDNELVTKTLDMDGYDFDNWTGSDLPYVSDWVLETLGYDEVDAYGNMI